MVDQRLPPPYELPEESEGEICGLVREHVYTVVAAQPDHLNQATPIGPCYRPKIESDVEDEEFLHEAQETQPTEDGNGSTETIPSQWEPVSTLDLHHVESPPAGPSQPVARSQSLDLLPLHPLARSLTPSGSDPALPMNSSRRRSSGGESYAHRHVRLSMHRLPIVPVTLPGMSAEINFKSMTI